MVDSRDGKIDYQLPGLMMHAGMKIRKIYSNSKKAMENVTTE
jgi:hypothetical protein